LERLNEGLPSVSARDVPRDLDSLSLVVAAHERPRDSDLPALWDALYESATADPVE